MYLGLDLGTTNIKALVVNPQGKVVARGSAPVEIRHLPDGGVEQDIENIYSATVAATTQATVGGVGKGVQAVGISAQGGAMQLLDSSGRPHGPVISWLDGRGTPYDREILQRLGSEYFAEHIGHGVPCIAIGQLLRLAKESPHLLAPPRRVGFVGDTIVHRLCGRFAHDSTSLSIAILYNPALRRGDPDVLKHLGIQENQLPDLLSPRQAAGELKADVAAKLGLPPGIPVSTAVHDQYCAVLGSAAVRGGDVMFGAGTAWVFVATTDHLAPPVIPEAFVSTHVVEGMYGQMLSMVNGGSALSWAKNLMGLGDKSGAETEKMLASVPPGCEGVRCWPLLATAGGARTPPGTRGRLLGLQFAHTPAHVLRAVIEGLAFEFARYLKFLTSAGIATDRLVMCGGAAGSAVTPPIIADATGLPVACCTEAATSAYGAAVLARGLLETNNGLAQIAESMAPPARTVHPSAGAGLYQTLAAEYARAVTT